MSRLRSCAGTAVGAPWFRSARKGTSAQVESAIWLRLPARTLPGVTQGQPRRRQCAAAAGKLDHLLEDIDPGGDALEQPVQPLRALGILKGKRWRLSGRDGAQRSACWICWSLSMSSMSRGRPAHRFISIRASLSATRIWRTLMAMRRVCSHHCRRTDSLQGSWLSRFHDSLGRMLRMGLSSTPRQSSTSNPPAPLVDPDVHPWRLQKVRHHTMSFCPCRNVMRAIAHRPPGRTYP